MLRNTSKDLQFYQYTFENEKSEKIAKIGKNARV